jgi:hypothetical protein
MKTPREILLARHRHALPKLDEIRQEFLAASFRAQVKSGDGRARAWLRSVWEELIWPSRHAWAGLAAVWVAVFLLNARLESSVPAVAAAKARTSNEYVQSFHEQRRLLGELLASAQTPPAQPPRPDHRPRSERAGLARAC